MTTITTSLWSSEHATVLSHSRNPPVQFSSIFDFPSFCHLSVPNYGYSRVTNSWRLWKWLHESRPKELEDKLNELKESLKGKESGKPATFTGNHFDWGNESFKKSLGGHNRDRVSMVVEWLPKLVSPSLSTVQEWVVWALVCSTCLQRSDRSDIPIVKSWCVSGGRDCWATEQPLPS